jgi:hypothetical protein
MLHPIISRFISIDSEDIFIYRKRVLRTQLFAIAETRNDLQLLKILKERPKTNIVNNLSVLFPDPLKDYKNLSLIQQKIIVLDDKLKYYGSFAFQSNCGSGKTVAALRIVHRFQCKTIIFSSRNSIKDQWVSAIKKIAPNIKIVVNHSNFKHAELKEIDILILSPQLICRYYNNEKKKFSLEDLPLYIKQFKPSLIIYDEIHSMMSESYSSAILFPFQMCIEKFWFNLPFLVSLSATYPILSYKSHKINFRAHDIKIYNERNRRAIFGNIRIYNEETLTNIPIKIWDFRNHYVKNIYDTKILDSITMEEAIINRGPFDSHYKVPNEDLCLKILVQKIGDKENEKGIVICHTIDSSIYTALYLNTQIDKSILIVRDEKSACYFISRHSQINNDEYIKFANSVLRKDSYLDILKTIDSSIDSYPKNLSLLKIMKQCKNFPIISQVEIGDLEKLDPDIVCGTWQRLKEGFNYDKLTWGIALKFPYGSITRTQILGRIRRNTEDSELKNKERVFYVVSGVVPTNRYLTNLRIRKEIKIKYNFEEEAEFFKHENYIYI